MKYNMKKLIMLLLLVSIAVLYGCAKSEEVKEEKKKEGTELPVTKLLNMKSGAEFYFFRHADFSVLQS